MLIIGCLCVKVIVCYVRAICEAVPGEGAASAENMLCLCVKNISQARVCLFVKSIHQTN